MAKGKKNADPVQKRLDRVIELLETLVMLDGKRYGLSREQIRTAVRCDANRVSKVTRGVAIPD